MSLVTTVVAAKVMGYDCGTAAGLLAGAFTESTVIGTAGNTISRLGLPEAETTRLLNNIPVAYAVSYLVGTSFVVWFLSSLAPRLLRVNLKEESRKLEAQSRVEGGDRDAVRLPRVGRAGLPHPGGVGRAPRGGRRGLLRPGPRLPRAGEAGGEASSTSLRTRSSGPATWRSSGRAGTCSSPRGRPFGEEIEDRELLDFPMAALDVVVTRKEVAERPLAEIAEEHGRGVVLLKLVRGGEEIPFAPGTVVNRGDLLRLAGTERDVERAGKALGYVERPSSETDVVFVGLGILLGGLFGALTLRVGDLPISLTASGGALIMGLVFGWLRSVRPTFGRIPEPALWVFDTIGLAVFIGCVGLAAGPSFVAGLRTTGPGLVVVSLLVALTPHLSAVLFGHYVLKMNPVLLLGACSGAGTATAALRAVQDEAGSKLPVLGYTVPYAIGNILLTAWGPVIVMLTR